MQSYTELDLRKMKGQALKDVWHSMIGKPVGLKNTTGLKNSEEIVQAILQGQANTEFLEPYKVREGKHKAVEPEHVEPMPPKEKKKPGPKPKSSVQAVQPTVPVRAVAVESMETPLSGVFVERIKLRKLHVNEQQYYLDAESKKVFAVEASGKPGSCVGMWNPITRAVSLS
jgi:hypothetical protein